MVALRSLVPIAHVRSVPRSIAFYRKLGFDVGNSVTPNGSSEPVWAWLRTNDAHLMVSKADGPFDAGQQAVLFYLYCDDVDAMRAELERAGVSVGPIGHPFYSPRGEFRVEDPDGYVLMIAHT